MRLYSKFCHLIENSGLLEIENGVVFQSIVLLHMRGIMFGQKLPEMMWAVNRSINIYWSGLLARIT